MAHDQNLHNFINLLGVTARVEEWGGDGLLISYRVRHIIVKLPHAPQGWARNTQECGNNPLLLAGGGAPQAAVDLMSQADTGEL